MRENIGGNRSIWTHMHSQSANGEVLNSARHPCADTISGLPNHVILDWYLEHLFAPAPALPTNCALLVIALDEVEAMRHTFGDVICNKFLRTIAQRFRATAQPGQFVSALGAASFAFVLSKNTGRERCIEVAGNLIAHASAAVRIDGRMCFSSAKIAIAFADINAETPAELLHRALVAIGEVQLGSSSSIRFADSNGAKAATEARYTHGKLHEVCERGVSGLH